MAHPQVRLILSDIDGTLLPKGEKCISERCAEAFRAAHAAGIVCGVATGRGRAQVAPIFRGDASFTETAIATNGLQVYLRGTMLCEKRITHENLVAMRAAIAACPGAGLLYFEGTTPMMLEGARDDLAEIMPSYAPIAVETDEIPAQGASKANCFLNTDDAGTDAFVRYLNERVEGVDFDTPMRGYTNTMPAGWNKGEAVKLLCAQVGCGLDEVVVFGDANNDLTMFEAVEHSVAVANATPEAAQAARWHIGSCEDDAVAAAIEQLAAGAWPFER